MVVCDDIAVFRHDDARAGRRPALERADDGYDAGIHLLVDLLEAQRVLLLAHDGLRTLLRWLHIQHLRRLLRLVLVSRLHRIVLGRRRRLRGRFRRRFRLRLRFRIAGLRLCFLPQALRLNGEVEAVGAALQMNVQRLRHPRDAKRRAGQQQHDQNDRHKIIMLLRASRPAHRRAAALTVILLRRVLLRICGTVIIKAGTVVILKAHYDTFFASVIFPFGALFAPYMLQYTRHSGGNVEYFVNSVLSAPPGS